MGTDQVYWNPGPLSSIFTLCDIRIADLLDSGFGIRCYRLMLAGSGCCWYCMEVKRTAPHRTMSTTIYCASNGYSGVWAFSRDAIVAFAPKEMLEGSEHSTGEVWEATLGDLDGALWAFSPVV